MYDLANILLPQSQRPAVVTMPLALCDVCVSPNAYVVQAVGAMRSLTPRIGVQRTVRINRTFNAFESSRTMPVSFKRCFTREMSAARCCRGQYYYYH